MDNLDTLGSQKLNYAGALDLDRTFDCGQCFRFTKTGGAWRGVAGGRLLSFETRPDGLYVSGCDCETAARFLALDDDYEAMAGEIIAPLTGAPRDYMTRAIEAGRGIHILRQEPFETLCSFILSQNNNIPRIKRLVDALCHEFGEPITGEDGTTAYAFPTAKAIADAGVDRVFALKTGFRAKYLCDAADAVMSGRVDFGTLPSLSTEDAIAQLTRIRGVGVKVASCTLLFGFGRLDVFPVDVWIRRALAEDFGPDFDYHVFGRYAGIAQQYIYFSKRAD